MASPAARLINWLLPLRGSRRMMRTEERMAAYYRRRVPQHAAPPRALLRRWRVERETLAGMTCYSVRAPRATAQHRVLYIHGGAYVNELVRPHWRIIDGIVSRNGAALYVPIYPLAPRHTWQDAYPLMRTLARRLLDEANGSCVTFMGDSAGGGFALAMTQCLRDEHAPLPDKLVLLSPWLDVQLEHPQHIRLAAQDRMLAIPGLRWAARQWAGSLAPQDPRISPLYGSLAGLPPIAVLTGTHDLLNADAQRLRERASASGHPLTYLEYPGMFHVWMAAPIPEAASALDQVARFMSS